MPQNPTPYDLWQLARKAEYQSLTDLSPEDQHNFILYTLSIGTRETPEDIFRSFKNSDHPPEVNPEAERKLKEAEQVERDQSIVNKALVAGLVAAMKKDQARLAEELKVSHRGSSQAQIDHLMSVWHVCQVHQFLKQNGISLDKQDELVEAVNQSAPKPGESPQIAIDDAAHKLIVTAIKDSPIAFSSAQIREAEATLIASIDTASVDPDQLNVNLIEVNPEIVQLLVETSLTLANKKYRPISPITTLVSQIDKNTSPATPEEVFNNPEGLNADGTTITNLSAVIIPVNLPTFLAKKQALTSRQDFDLLSKTLITQSAIAQNNFKNNPLLLEATRSLTPGQYQQFLEEARKIGIDIKATPGYDASYSAGMLEKLNHTPEASSACLAYGQISPPQFQKVIVHIQNNPESALAKSLPPQTINRLVAQYALINKQAAKPDSLAHTINQKQHPEYIQQQRQQISQQLGPAGSPEQLVHTRSTTSPETIPQDWFSRTIGNQLNRFAGRTSTQVSNRFSKLTFRFSETFNRVKTAILKPFQPLIPYVKRFSNTISRYAPIVRVIFHPIDFLKSWTGHQLGKRFAGQAIRNMGAFVIRKIGNRFVKKVALELFKNGIKAAGKFLWKQAAIRGLQALAQAANVVPGLGLVIAGAIEVGAFVLERTIGFLKNKFDEFFTAIFGEPPQAKHIIMVPATLVVAFVGALGMVAATAMTTMAKVAIGSTAAGLFLYLTAFTMGPIIASFAQLDPNMYTQSGSRGGQGGPNATPRPAVIPPTEQLAEGCPSGSPNTYGFPVTQEPHGEYSHRQAYSISIGGVTYQSEGEAIDYAFPIGTQVIATHNGILENRDGGSFGKHSVIVSKCNSHPFISIYAHLSTFSRSSGSVSKGEVIGRSGSTGNSTGPHLHYEIMGLGDLYRYL